MRSPKPVTDQPHWDDLWSSGTHVRILSDRDPVVGRHGWYLRALPPFNGKRVVELGGAGSYILLGIAKQGATVTAVDYSQVGIALTREIFAANGEAVRTYCADVFTWEPAERFDAVVHFGLIEHFEDPLPLLPAPRHIDLSDSEGPSILRTVPAVERRERVGRRYPDLAA